MMQLTIILISYNSKDAIKHCLTELLDSIETPVIIVDNASSDGSAEIIATRFPDATIVALDKNIGYGRAANNALKQVDTPYALLLNPDLHTTCQDVEKLLQHAEKSADNIAILAPAVKEQDYAQRLPQSVEWISGSAMLFNMKNLKEIGFFDENIFLFSEETDLCRRTIDAGYKILKCPNVLMRHIKGQSSPVNPEVEYMKNWHFGWSYAYYYTKHNMAFGKRSPARMTRNYRMKSLFAIAKLKKEKYKARGDGVRAFINGVPAFRDDGHPQASPETRC